MLHLSAPKGKNLVGQIKALGSKGVLPPDIVDWANEIRYWGNDGAHPSTDGLDEISLEEATEMKEFVERVFEWAYIKPAKVASSRAVRASKEASSQGEEGKCWFVGGWGGRANPPPD